MPVAAQVHSQAGCIKTAFGLARFGGGGAPHQHDGNYPDE